MVVDWSLGWLSMLLWSLGEVHLKISEVTVMKGL